MYASHQRVRHETNVAPPLAVRQTLTSPEIAAYASVEDACQISELTPSVVRIPKYLSRWRIMYDAIQAQTKLEK
jgi:hypothetical protein